MTQTLAFPDALETPRSGGSFARLTLTLRGCWPRSAKQALTSATVAGGAELEPESPPPQAPRARAVTESAPSAIDLAVRFIGRGGLHCLPSGAVTRPTNTELIRAGIEAFNRGDSEAILETLTEDVEWKRVDGLPDGGGVLHGREAVREFLKPDVFAAERSRRSRWSRART